jgi:hypothetical protein
VNFSDENPSVLLLAPFWGGLRTCAIKNKGPLGSAGQLQTNVALCEAALLHHGGLPPATRPGVPDLGAIIRADFDRSG